MQVLLQFSHFLTGVEINADILACLCFIPGRQKKFIALLQRQLINTYKDNS